MVLFAPYAVLLLKGVSHQYTGDAAVRRTWAVHQGNGGSEAHLCCAGAAWPLTNGKDEVPL